MRWVRFQRTAWIVGSTFLMLIFFATLNAIEAQTLTTTGYSVCPVIDAVARANALPVEFLTRAIWQESGFKADATGPVTRNGERAQGIAQFMPSTAAERGLIDPLNPTKALPKSAEFFAELRDEFGNLGLAAAAYNAGPERVRLFLAGKAELPDETRKYVLAITGRTIDDWTQSVKVELPQGAQDNPVATDLLCKNVLARLRQKAELNGGRHVPRWCEFLHHPNVSMCGPVRLSIVSSSSSTSIFRSHVHFPRRHEVEAFE
jgi:hypothetical protein